MEALERLSEEFIDETNGAVPRLIQSFENLLYSENPNPQNFEGPDEDGRRIRTRTENSYEPGDRAGAYHVAGELSFRWKVQIPDTTAPRNRRNLRLVGNASTKLRVVQPHNDGSDQLLAQWQVEIGTNTAPGCLFHFGIGQINPAPAFFPSGLSIPRLPSIFVTPSDGLDYLLGELFQTGWRRRNSENLDACGIWSDRQKQRLRAILRWKHDELDDRVAGSAWNWLKHRLDPPPGLFLPDD